MMYRPYILLFLILISIAGLKAQVIQPATWTVSTSSEKVKVGEEIDIYFDVLIDPDWYLYSSDFDPDCGPMVTTFTFDKHPGYERVGEVVPVDPKTKYDDIFECEYTYFRGKARFIQTVKVLSENVQISGTYAYQVCTDVDGKCIPFDDEFTIEGLQVVSSGDTASPEQQQVETKPQTVTTEELPSVDTLGEESNAFGTGQVEITEQLADEEKTEIDPASIPEVEKAGLTGRTSNDPYSLLAFMLLAFVAGLAAILTPCVFPMIPVTVTFFTTGSGSRRNAVTKGLTYGVSIILIYTIIGVVVSMLFGAEVANDLATSATANLIFFVIFVLFGLSFLGLFEITLPNSWVSNVDSQADKGGLLGILFMAFTLVLVSFSCTGPIVGSILVESAGGQFLKPTLGMFAFSLAFALPFTLFAIFPDWLSALPKSGGWLNSVKVVLGFVELALALKFLSIADQVYHWGILDREVFLAIWIVIMVLLGLYLLGKIRLPHDSELKFISVPRLLLATVVFSFVVYLIPGMFGAPLKALAGYLPPMTTHDFDLVSMIRENRDGTVLAEEKLCDTPKYGDLFEFPHGIEGYFDFEQAMACAREQKKPLFIDFTGHGCVNCREMEARVWSDSKVLTRLKNNFIVVALYVDDKTELPESEWYESEYDGKVKKTIGKQNADFQITEFNNNAQPYYVILDNEAQLLVEPTAYDLDISNFVQFLDNAVEVFEKRNSEPLARQE